MWKYLYFNINFSGKKPACWEYFSTQEITTYLPPSINPASTPFLTHYKMYAFCTTENTKVHKSINSTLCNKRQPWNNATCIFVITFPQLVIAKCTSYNNRLYFWGKAQNTTCYTLLGVIYVWLRIHLYWVLNFTENYASFSVSYTYLMMSNSSKQVPYMWGSHKVFRRKNTLELWYIGYSFHTALMNEQYLLSFIIISQQNKAAMFESEKF